MLRVGVVGLGRMGAGMALNVAKAGFPLSMYDAEEGRTQELRESWVKDKHLCSGTFHLHALLFFVQGTLCIIGADPHTHTPVAAGITSTAEAPKHI